MDTYREQDAGKFMDKIVQVTFNLPQISDDDFETYMDGMDAIDADSREKIRPYLQHILPTTQNNPRRFKRFLNDLYLMEAIHRNKNTGIDYKSLLFWKIVEFQAPQLVRETNENPEILNILRDIVIKVSEEDKATGKSEIPADKIKEIPQKSLHPYLENRKLTDLIRNMEVTGEQVRQLISLGSIVKSAETVEDVEERIRVHEFESRAKNKLDEMVKVPAGDFKYGDDNRIVTIDEPFEIDIYPVTNAQFKAFIEDNGYGIDDYWSPEGLKRIREENITQPRYWDDEKWNQPEHPVVGVSFYEAEAFAAWAKKSLPTEEQWERAAPGTEGHKYPWGDDFDKEKCNIRESGIEKTTRVTRYPNGISPVSCYDMAGNVWEWTSSYHDKDKDTMVLRGGSWDFDAEFARCAFRERCLPVTGSFFIGFRCVRTSK
jgi:iron(II)-dependent oxidoreductase